MKKLYFTSITIFLIAAYILFTPKVKAQSPDKISYQAVVRDGGNNLISNTVIGVQISILQGSQMGTAVYVETQTPETNTNGLLSIEIGGEEATIISGNLSSINWSDGPYFIQTEIDPNGGINYSINGVSPLTSVPYALHAKTAETFIGAIDETDPVFSNSQAANITANDINNLSNLSGINTGDQDLTGLAIKTELYDTAAAIRLDIPDVSNFISTETDPVFSNSVASGITSADTAAWNASAIGSYIETDPIFTGSEAANITLTDITNLSNLSGINSGDQDLSGIAINQLAIIDTASAIRADIPDVSSFVSTETDPEFMAWDKTTGININESQILDLQNYLTIESDPDFNASIAAVITEIDTANWNNKLDSFTETDPEFTTWDKTSGIHISESQITDLQNYLTVEVDGDETNELQVLSISNDTIYLSEGGYAVLPEQISLFDTTANMVIPNVAIIDIANDDFVFGSEQLEDDNNSDHDHRFYYDKSKGSFRAGAADDKYWDYDSVGTHSVAFGKNNVASGYASSAMGVDNRATGAYSLAFGAGNTASAHYTTAFGQDNEASDFYATAFGWENQSTYQGATTFGRGNIASHFYATAFGRNNTASQYYTTAFGYDNTASGRYSTVWGGYNTAPSGFETVIGRYAETYTPSSTTGWNDADRLFVVGNGSSSSRSNALTILKDGSIGIGVSEPTNAKVEISGIGSSQTISGIGYLNTGGSGTGNVTAGFSLYASGRIAGYAFIAHSDERIKKIIGLSNSKDDLNTLLQIGITDYKMKDSVQYGNTPIKKVIAQQLKVIYPQAVTTNNTQIVPDIYQRSEIQEGWITLPTTLKIDDKVQIISNKTTSLYKVIAVEENRFKIDAPIEGEVFVYGKQVTDFHSVDYEALSTLNISATQELARRIETLELENTKLKKELDMERKINASRLNKIEERLGINLKAEK